MGSQSLEDKLQSVDSPARMLQEIDVDAVEFPHVPDEVTHWIEEQRSWQESCCLADQSHHMTELHVEGPDALDLFSDLGVNDFAGFEPKQAKQLVVTSPEGYMIGDGILFYLAEEEFLLVGGPAAPNWVEFHADTGGYDVDVERQGSSRFDQYVESDPSPDRFRYQIQGPNALDVMEAVTEDPLPDIGFFNFDTMVIDGVEIEALRHGMAGEAGYEFWGDFEDAETVREAVLDAGEEYGIRQLGRRSYQTTPVVVGWVPLPLPAVYGEETREYREWLDADSYEGICSLGGSFNSDDVEDYYLRPSEVGYGRFVDLDHDFVGRDALAEAGDPERTLVTLEWDSEDVVDAYASLFDEGPTQKFVDLLVPRWAAVHYDEVRKDGEMVGVSKWGSYIYNERAMLSLAAVDADLSDPGTEVTVLWGDPSESHRSAVEDHVQTEITATVAPVPYSEDRR